MKLENEYVNGEINIKEYVINDDVHRYWLKVGVALLELKPEHMYDLHELLESWVKEYPETQLREHPQIRLPESQLKDDNNLYKKGWY